MSGSFPDQPLRRDDKWRQQFNLKGTRPLTKLTATSAAFGAGGCMVNNADLFDDPTLVGRLLKELDMVGEEFEPASWLGANVIIDKLRLGESSGVHMISLNYGSRDPDQGLANVRIGDTAVFDFGYPTVTVNDDASGYAFHGGSVGVASRQAKPNRRVRIERALEHSVVAKVDRG